MHLQDGIYKYWLSHECHLYRLASPLDHRETSCIGTYPFVSIVAIIDSCQVNNGGCDANAVCSRDSTTGACRCTCKTGYTNTGTAPSVVCAGRRRSSCKIRSSFVPLHCQDSCQVNNGGCGANTVCSHDSTTYAVKCSCKVGYTNTGSTSNVICTGKQPVR